MDDQAKLAFMHHVDSSQFLTEKFKHMVDKVNLDAKRLFGMELTPDEVLDLNECKLGVFGSAFEQEAYERELEAHPKFATIQREKRIASGDLDERAKAIAECLEEKTPMRRMIAARKLGLKDSPAPVSANMSKEDRINAVLAIPAAKLADRIALARSLGFRRGCCE